MTRSGSHSRSPKRARIETSAPEDVLDDSEVAKSVADDEDRCSICLQSMLDRTVVPICSHEFCFDCLLVWTEQSRRCPLCSQNIGDFLIHNIRARYDYQKHYLAPLPSSPAPAQTLPPRDQQRLERARGPRRRHRDREWGRREPDENDEADRLDRSILKRRWVYEHGLYAKHVASNSYTRYRPYPTPAQFASSQDHISRTIMFLRRELRVWVNLDVEFLTNFTISLMKAIDIRSESAVKLLAEFLDLDAPYIEGERHVNAEHFAHEVYSFVRSPYKDLFVYDNVVQYDVPATIPPPPTDRRRRRWRSPSLSSERERHRRRRSRSYSVPRSRSRSRDRRPNEQYSRERNAMELDVRERQRRPRSRSYSASRSRSPSQKQRLEEDSAMQLDMSNERGLPGEITSGPEVKGKGRARSPSEESLVSLGTVSSAPLITPPLSGGRETQSSGHSREQSSSDPILTNGRIRWRSPAPAVRSKEESSKPPVARNPKPPPRVRHRSLLESVQAHLARPPTSDESRPIVATTSNDTDQDYTYDIHFEREDTPPPSLLLRMSDAHTGRPLVPQNHQREADGIGGRGGEAISPTTQDGGPARRGFVNEFREATPILEAATASKSKSASTSRQMRPRLSAPEIMALTRARHARLGLPIAVATPAPAAAAAPARASTLPMSVSVADGLEQDGTGGANRENPGASTTTTMAPTSSNSGARASLLRRLEEEKARAKLAVTGVQGLGNANSNLTPAMPANAVVIVDTAAIEARLRRQAMLRVRLAAEKRRATMS